MIIEGSEITENVSYLLKFKLQDSLSHAPNTGHSAFTVVFHKNSKTKKTKPHCIVYMCPALG